MSLTLARASVCAVALARGLLDRRLRARAFTRSRVDHHVCARDARRRADARQGVARDRDVATSRARDVCRGTDDDARVLGARER